MTLPGQRRRPSPSPPARPPRGDGCASPPASPSRAGSPPPSPQASQRTRVDPAPRAPPPAARGRRCHARARRRGHRRTPARRRRNRRLRAPAPPRHRRRKSHRRQRLQAAWRARGSPRVPSPPAAPPSTRPERTRQPGSSGALRPRSCHSPGSRGCSPAEGRALGSAPTVPDRQRSSRQTGRRCSSRSREGSRSRGQRSSPGN
mmetsp:Transcript_21943/g.52444  ORF Transcript_21943/g.52444 Transcript_21943/m.52444 type:complete len:203 (-) Transcript_21943:677-1285(-)